MMPISKEYLAEVNRLTETAINLIQYLEEKQVTHKVSWVEDGSLIAIQLTTHAKFYNQVLRKGLSEVPRAKDTAVLFPSTSESGNLPDNMRRYLLKVYS